MELFYRRLGTGSPLVILHGLFGMSDNWLTIAKRLAEDFEIWLPDMRNHGRSPHNARFDYPVLVDDITGFLDQHHLDKVNILGHSMGGKIAMGLALQQPQRVRNLLVADMAPRRYERPYFKTFLQQLQQINLSGLQSRREANQRLQAAIPQPAVRQFLLKNLYRDAKLNFHWRINIEALLNHIDEILGDGRLAGKWDGPALFLRGEKSDYVQDDDMQVIRQLFPAARVHTLAGAGHWVHVEAAEEMYREVRNFLKEK